MNPRLDYSTSVAAVIAMTSFERRSLKGKKKTKKT